MNEHLPTLCPYVGAYIRHYSHYPKEDYRVFLCLFWDIANNYRDRFENCTNEQQFKKAFIKDFLSEKQCKAFCIETEETSLGFPDVAYFEGTEKNMGLPMQSNLFEFKFADKSGAITFKPTQPAFYKKNKDLDIYIVAYNKKSGLVHIFEAACLLDKSSHYYTNGKARINLSKIEAAFAAEEKE